jgi:hypothetical protein
VWCRVFKFPLYYTTGSQILVVTVLVLEKCNAWQAVLACVTAIMLHMVNKCEGCGSEICTIGSYILYAEKEHQNI